jgi:hypothetical protein
LRWKVANASEIFPQICGTAVGATFATGLGFAPLALMIMGWIATADFLLIQR